MNYMFDRKVKGDRLGASDVNAIQDAIAALYPAWGVNHTTAGMHKPGSVASSKTLETRWTPAQVSTTSVAINSGVIKRNGVPLAWTPAGWPFTADVTALTTNGYYIISAKLDVTGAPTAITMVKTTNAWPTYTDEALNLRVSRFKYYPVCKVTVASNVIQKIEQLAFSDFSDVSVEPDSDWPDSDYRSITNDNVSRAGDYMLSLYDWLNPTPTALDNTGSNTAYFLFRQWGNPGGPIDGAYLRYASAEQTADAIEAFVNIAVSQITDLETWLSVSVDSYLAALNQKSCDTYTNGGNEYIGLWRFDTGTNEAGVELDAESKIPFRDYDGSSVKTLGYSTKAEFATWIQAQLSIAYSQLTGVTAKRYGDLDPDDMVVVKT